MVCAGLSASVSENAHAMGPLPRSPESSARLETEETNPLPNVSSAKAWTAISFPKAAPIIREKVTAPRPPHRIRADGTEEICVEDILVIVPRMKDKQPSSDELGDEDIVVDVAEAEPEQQEEFRPPAYSVHATQEILADDVLAVSDAPVTQDDRPSTVPWTIDANPLDEFEFPTPPQMSGPYGAVRRITNYSATQVFRRRNNNVKVVAASVGLALSVMMIAGIARMAPSTGSDGPVGIAMRAPKKLDKAVRGRVLAYGTAARIDSGVTISIDSLPSRPLRRHR